MDLEGRGRGAGAEGERGGEWEAGSRRRGGGVLVLNMVALMGGGEILFIQFNLLSQSTNP